MGTESARERIIQAAIGCITRLGLERTSISGVAAVARVSRPTVYSHFGSRQELISAALEQAATDVTERIIAKASRTTTAADFVVEALVAAHREFRSDPSVSPIAQVSSDPRWPTGRTLSPETLAVARRFMQPLLRFDPTLGQDLDEITETAVRFLLSLLIFPSERSKTDARLRNYLHRRLVPALGLPPAARRTRALSMS
jgi:AcrR family transcriptional regulator